MIIKKSNVIICNFFWIGLFWEDEGSGIYVVRIVGGFNCYFLYWIKFIVMDCEWFWVFLLINWRLLLFELDILEVGLLVIYVYILIVRSVF